MFPALRLYYNSDHFPLDKKLIHNGKLISLPLLFETYPNSFLTVVKGQSYGKFLDEEIKKVNKNNIIVRAGLNQHKAIAIMLLKKLIDFSLVYPTTDTDNIIEEENKKVLYSVAIQGNIPYILGYVMCSKTSLGAKAINKINASLDQLYLEDRFYKHHTDFLESNYHNAFKKDFLYIFKERHF